jgi:hypothetical protein
MAEAQNGYLIIFLVILGIVIINIGIIKQFTSKRSNEAQLLSKTIDAAKNPWKKENQDLDELTRLVENVKQIEEAGKSVEEINQDNKTSNQ